MVSSLREDSTNILCHNVFLKLYSGVWTNHSLLPHLLKPGDILLSLSGIDKVRETWEAFSKPHLQTDMTGSQHSADSGRADWGANCRGVSVP